MNPGQPDMIDFIAWALTVEALGLIALPVTFVLFSRLPYGGYAFSKPLGHICCSASWCGSWD